MSRDASRDQSPSTSIGAGLLTSVFLHAAGVVALAFFGNTVGGATAGRTEESVKISLDALPPLPPELQQPKPDEPPIPKEDQIKLGIADGVTQTETWLGYKDPTPHSATPATIEQAAMSIASGPMSELGIVGGEAPTAEDGLDAPAEQPSPPAPPELTPAQAEAQVPPQAQPAPQQQPPTEVASPVPQPAPAPPPPAGSKPPPPPKQDDAPLDSPDTAPPPASDLSTPVTEHPADKPPPASDPLPQEEKQPSPVDQPKPEDLPVSDKPVDAPPSDQPPPESPAEEVNKNAPTDQPTEPQPPQAQPEQSPKPETPEGTDAQKSPPQDQPPTTAEPRPTPPSPAAPAAKSPSVKGSRPGTSGRPGDLTDQYADPTSLLRDVVDVVPGRPAAAKGLKIKTTPPQWGVTTTLIRSARNPIVWIKFGRNGKVVHADFVKGYNGGSPDIDGPLLNAIHEWRAEGEELKKIPDRKDAGIVITMRITLRSI